MSLFARSDLPSRTALLMQQAYTPPAIAIATAVLMSLLIGLLWSVGWLLGAGLVIGCFYVSMGLLRPSALERIGGSLAVSGLVIASGLLFGGIAAGCASFILLLPLGLAALGVEES